MTIQTESQARILLAYANRMAEAAAGAGDQVEWAVWEEKAFRAGQFLLDFGYSEEQVRFYASLTIEAA